MMNLKTDLVKNKENTIIKFNFITIVLIFIVLCLETTLFLSISLGIIFTIFSVIYLIFMIIVKNKLLEINKIKKENEKLS